MLVSNSGEQSFKNRCFGKKRKFKFLSKMTHSSMASPYERMDDDVREVKKMKKKKVKKLDEECKDKENVEIKDKKSKRKTWKLIRSATLTTCRYIGMGVAHMSPVASYGSPDYCVDPKTWNKSFNRSVKNMPPHHQTGHWTNTMMFSSW
ncbi:uncharacterized protein [Parasteatoda tepidariorum]|uniref:uncharacterized protein n=1 Tax=Parasteatoda tepidariorum TaxID=114398 RepID=UPI00077F893E|nr:uncharacterized protein LOC107455066 [Parasteatoda tepidariorum]XP_015927966.1 uncharacterized protein LOC107455066 [Parasteatoda tepidariorum]XP_015927967.1 uncharacterized protein LOC107455066 [Parasteatoda tepidariorum]XP_015927968.1 uncharacterized protein LOC107455066 [Parasteatoda tepidariorum]